MSTALCCQEIPLCDLQRLGLELKKPEHPFLSSFSLHFLIAVLTFTYFHLTRQGGGHLILFFLAFFQSWKVYIFPRQQKTKCSKFSLKVCGIMFPISFLTPIILLLLCFPSDAFLFKFFILLTQPSDAKIRKIVQLGEEYLILESVSWAFWQPKSCCK